MKAERGITWEFNARAELKDCNVEAYNKTKTKINNNFTPTGTSPTQSWYLNWRVVRKSHVVEFEAQGVSVAHCKDTASVGVIELKRK